MRNANTVRLRLNCNTVNNGCFDAKILVFKEYMEAWDGIATVPIRGKSSLYQRFHEVF